MYKRIRTSSSLWAFKALITETTPKIANISELQSTHTWQPTSSPSTLVQFIQSLLFNTHYSAECLSLSIYFFVLLALLIKYDKILAKFFNVIVGSQRNKYVFSLSQLYYYTTYIFNSSTVICLTFISQSWNVIIIPDEK